MTAAAKSIYYFSFYLFIIGFGLMTMPNKVIPIMGLPESNEVWIRVVGLIAAVIGVYYYVSAKNNYIPIFKASVMTRIGVLLFTIICVLLQLAPWPFIGFGIIDFIGALWTYFSLKKG